MTTNTILAAAFVILAAGQPAIAQVAAPTERPKEWNGDLAGAVGLTPGIGAATTRVDLSASVAVVRTTRTADFDHHCRGVTAMVTVASGEQSFLVGPRWDAGDLESAVFVRLLTGVRRVSGTRDANGQREPSDSTVAFGAGAGLAVLGVLLDVNWTVSPWASRAPHRLTVSLGYIWSFQ